MRHKRGRHRPQSRVTPVHLLAAAAILGLLVMPVAFAQDGEPSATKSGSVAKQIKKLKRRIAALEAKNVPASLPPNGPAGGDLTGTYPNPLIGPNAVGSAEIANGAVTESDIGSNALDGTSINEPGLAIPRAWAVVDDPDGAAQPGGDPQVVASEGVLNVNDGDPNDTEGIHCYELGFTPDLVLANLAIGTGEFDLNVGTASPGGNSCAAGFDARLWLVDSNDSTLDSGDVQVAFFDLE